MCRSVGVVSLVECSLEWLHQKTYFSVLRMRREGEWGGEGREGRKGSSHGSLPEKYRLNIYICVVVFSLIENQRGCTISLMPLPITTNPSCRSPGYTVHAVLTRAMVSQD